MNAKKQLKKLTNYLENEHAKATKLFELATTENEKTAFCFKSLAFAQIWGYLFGLDEDQADTILTQKNNK